MISIPQIELNACREYIRRVKGNSPRDSYLANRYLFILVIWEWQLKRRVLNRVASLDDLATLKTGHREAERLLFDIAGGAQKDVIAHVESILQALALEFHAEIKEIEARHPAMSQDFARECEQYRLMWNEYVKDN